MADNDALLRGLLKGFERVRLWGKAIMEHDKAALLQADRDKVKAAEQMFLGITPATPTTQATPMAAQDDPMYLGDNSGNTTIHNYPPQGQANQVPAAATTAPASTAAPAVATMGTLAKLAIGVGLIGTGAGIPAGIGFIASALKPVSVQAIAPAPTINVPAPQITFPAQAPVQPTPAPVLRLLP